MKKADTTPAELTRREAPGRSAQRSAALTLINCGAHRPLRTPTTSTATTTSDDNAACAVADRNVGPYPSIANFIRSDIREGKTASRSRAAITVVNASSNCSPVSGAIVDIWQCDADGHILRCAQQG